MLIDLGKLALLLVLDPLSDLLVLQAVQDPVEGPEARAEAVRRLGEDPGWNEQMWIDAVRKAVGGAR